MDEEGGGNGCWPGNCWEIIPTLVGVFWGVEGTLATVKPPRFRGGGFFIPPPPPLRGLGEGKGDWEGTPKVGCQKEG